MHQPWLSLAFLLLLPSLISSLSPVDNLSSSWVNSATPDYLVKNYDIQTILYRIPPQGPGFLCGFCCEDNETCFFGVFIWPEYNFIGSTALIWSANRNHPVRLNATLNFTQSGNLVLKDVDGTLVWSTSNHSKGKAALGMNLTELGNLVIYGENSSIVWQSFDHPTDCLLPGQRLVPGQKLTSNTSSSNVTEGLFSISFTGDALVAYMDTSPRLSYFEFQSATNFGLEDGSFYFTNNWPYTQFTRLENDGHLRVYERESSGWLVVEDVFTSDIAPHPLGPLPNAPHRTRSRRLRIISGSSLGALFGALFLLCSCYIFYKRFKEHETNDELYVGQATGMLTRFSLEDLKVATRNFTTKLGEGGFGSVFEGVMSNEVKVAVKRLDGLEHIKKSFLAEVETIGSIHHVNLVRLIGFCFEKSHRLLVYEYMPNGSLDKWIFRNSQELTLGWPSRRKIIMDIAKGLAYLHEDCRKKIFHLDIKPQNILLDEDFTAKVSDFGLAKLIEKDQSRIMTTLRGTPGYLAPEWLSSVITEKVDVYSFGVVVLEILCGRKNLDRSQPEDNMHLLSLFERKAKEGQLLDIVDRRSEHMQLYSEEVVEMMKIVVWCLQNDYSKRPSMSTVVKVLEGSVIVANDLDYNISNFAVPRSSVLEGHAEEVLGDPTLLPPSTLSGPR